MIKLNGTAITPTIFPDKTSQVWKLPEAILKSEQFVVTWEFEHEAEFMHVAQLRMLRFGAADLYLPYLPYARQDKPVSNARTFALWPFMVLLNALEFTRVVIFDVHNPDVVRGGIANVELIDPVSEISSAMWAVSAEVICFPDAGARGRYESMVARAHIHAEKVRDQATGEITSLELHGDPRGLRVLIVDDLCDGGMTFIKLAERLYAAGAREVHLYVSHGLFTKGLQVLRDSGIQRIFTRLGEMI